MAFAVSSWVSSEALGLTGTLLRFTVCDNDHGHSFGLLAVGLPPSGVPRIPPLGGVFKEQEAGGRALTCLAGR